MFEPVSASTSMNVYVTASLQGISVFKREIGGRHKGQIDNLVAGLSCCNSSGAEVSALVFKILTSFSNLPFSASPSNARLRQMAAVMSPEKAQNSAEYGDLTEEQIDALLAGATARLKAKSQSKELTSVHETYTFPKLQTGDLEKPYVSTTKQNIATADSARLVDEKQRKKADGIRRVEEPVMAKIASNKTVVSY